MPHAVRLIALVGLVGSFAGCGASDGPKEAANANASGSPAPSPAAADPDAGKIRLRYFDVRDVIASQVAPADEVTGVAQGFTGPEGSVDLKNGVLIARAPKSSLDAIQKYLEGLRAKSGGAPGAPLGAPPPLPVTVPAPPSGSR